jgi:Zn-dependent protease with chaperone function
MTPPMVGLALGASWFLIALTVFDWIAMRLMRMVSVRTRSTVAFAIGVSPTIGALFFVVGIFLPAQWRFEPAQSTETISWTILTLMVLTLMLLVGTATRAIRTVRVSNRLVTQWTAGARRLTISGSPIPVFAIDERFPVAAVAGPFRPRILIADRLVGELTTAEFDAVLAHELAHYRSGDNLKRFVLECGFGVWSHVGRRPAWTQRWRDASEYDADAAAAQGDPVVAVALASALLKVARLVEGSTVRRAVWSGLLHGGSIADRVRRLVGFEVDTRRPPSVAVRGVSIVVVLAGITLCSPALRMVHLASEWLLHEHCKRAG